MLIIAGSKNQCPEKLFYSLSIDTPRFQQLKQVKFPAIQRAGLIQPFLRNVEVGLYKNRGRNEAITRRPWRTNETLVINWRVCLIQSVLEVHQIRWNLKPLLNRIYRNLFLTLDGCPWSIYACMWTSYYKESIALTGGQFILNIEGHSQDKAAEGKGIQIIQILKV